MEANKEIGRRFRVVRKAVGYSPEQAGKLVCRSAVHYAKIESGNNAFSEDVLSRFTQAFARDPQALRRYLLVGGEMPAISAPETRQAQGVRDPGERYAAPAHPPDEAVPVYPPELTKTPVLGFAQAAGFEPALESLNDFLGTFAEETHAWAEAKEGWFTLRVEGDSMAPKLPHGTLLLVAGGQFPRRGQIAVAKLSTGQVVVKKYSRKENVVTLSSLNPEGQTFTWHVKEQAGYVQWMWPVVRAEIDLDWGLPDEG
jgi:SOS-response transcriptional repressor LexA